MLHNRFKTSFSENIWKQKYSQGTNDSWDALAERVVEDVCGTRWGKDHALMSDGDRAQLAEYIKEMKFVPGGRYIFYSGRPNSFFNNCFLLRAEFDTREEWADLTKRAVSCLMTGGGIGIDYCLSPETPVLCKDLSWKPVGSLKIGDDIVAFDESTNLQKALTRYAKVEETGRVLKPCFEIETSEGKLTASDNHRFIARKIRTSYKKKGQGFQWVKAEDLTNEYEIAFSISPWQEQSNYELGWLGGLFDGEGWISRSKGKLTCGFAQNAGIVLDKGISLLEKYDIKYNINYNAGDKLVQVNISGKWNIAKLFSLAKPIRLIENAGDFLEGRKMSTKVSKPARVISVSPVGIKEVVALATSTNTLIGGGYYSHNTRLRPSGRPLSKTGGISSGPIALMQMINEVGRGVMQGGSRRSAIYASLNWQHEDIPAFLHAKDWSDTIKKAKAEDFNFPGPLDMTNISVNYDDAWGCEAGNPVFLENCRQAMMTGEPGFSFNFGDKENETLRNACCEVTSEDDSDVCNLGSINLGNISSLSEFESVVGLASKFLVCGTLRADLPYDKVYTVREKNRRLGLGLMGISEWLLQRRSKYEVTPELHKWLEVYKNESERAANEHCERLFISKPVAYRAIAPTGSLSILAGTTTGIEPLFAVAYKRRYLTDGTKWKYEYVVDSTADLLIREYGLDPDSIDTAYKLSHDYERRIKFQADIQDYVDMSISSTINLPSWNTKGNSEGDVQRFAHTLAKYAPRLRGFTCYPDGSRGGQPLTEVSYEEALKHKGTVFEEHDVCDITGHGGSCGV